MENSVRKTKENKQDHMEGKLFCGKRSISIFLVPSCSYAFGFHVSSKLETKPNNGKKKRTCRNGYHSFILL